MEHEYHKETGTSKLDETFIKLDELLIKENTSNKELKNTLKQIEAKDQYLGKAMNVGQKLL